ncbi:MAG: alpha/beta hydrolase [Candidatus Eisenbacteria bacterium]|uniref:Alpha/beta hydrolase n=1 Tax=Eiseniibacteriota bacterium TaxID=2212470 RepID=A0A849SR32_UNCEI|nr:alpha/beta hydrolase [Candidatus Eisenbacteria bacterium]
MIRAPRFLTLLMLIGAVTGLALLRESTPTPNAHGTFGRGPRVVLVHGLGSSDADWLPTARALARRHQVTLVDLPGHGLSDMPHNFSLEEARVALDVALAEIGNEPVTLVGHSVGGLVCAAEALASPGRVRALVLIETALKPPMNEAARAGLLAALDSDYDGVIHAAYLDFGRDAEQGERLYREVRALDSTTVKRWIRLAMTSDISAQMTRLQPPMLAIFAPRTWGPDERWEDVAAIIGFDQVPQLEVERIRDAGHFVMLDQPQELAARIARFAAHPEGEPIAGR